MAHAPGKLGRILFLGAFQALSLIHIYIPAGSGMGTCGLVGPIGIYTAMGGGSGMWLGILMVCFVLPAVLTFIFGEVLRKMGWIKEGDLKLDL